MARSSASFRRGHPADDVVDGDQDSGADHPTDERVVRPDDRILDRVADKPARSIVRDLLGLGFGG
jgi:hypothetical protein